MRRGELRGAYEEADRRMKATDGHQFVQILKTRCQFCNRSRAQTKGKRCGGWFGSFLNHLESVLVERGEVEQ